MRRTTLQPGVHPVTRIGGPPEDRRYVEDPDLPYSEPVIERTAIIQSFVTVDGGVVPGPATHVGAGAFIMAHCHVGHNAQVGEGAELAPHCVLGGWSVVREAAKLGMGAIVLPYRTVGARAVIGAGSVVTSDVPPGEVWAGNPARPLPGKNPIPFTER